MRNGLERLFSFRQMPTRSLAPFSIVFVVISLVVGTFVALDLAFRGINAERITWAVIGLLFVIVGIGEAVAARRELALRRSGAVPEPSESD